MIASYNVKLERSHKSHTHSLAHTHSLTHSRHALQLDRVLIRTDVNKHIAGMLHVGCRILPVITVFLLFSRATLSEASHYIAPSGVQVIE
jgi:hypothetical protein